MSWQKVPHWIAATAITVTTPIVLLLVNLFLLTTPTFVRVEYNSAGFPPAETKGFTEEERLRYAVASLRYLRSSQGIEALQELEHEGEPLYNVRELVHMADVKVVMYWTFVVFWVSFAILLVASIYVLSTPGLASRLPIYIFRGCLILGLVLAAISALALASFGDFFVGFHLVFFTGDSWLFQPSDALIRLFPLEFWMDAALAWIVLAFAETIVVGAAAYLWPGWEHGR